MNDLDLVRTMRADAPIPSQRRLDAGRERLLAAIGSSSPAGGAGRTPRRRFGGVRGMVLAGGVAAVAAVAVAVQVGVRPVTLNTTPAAESAKYTDLMVERAAFGWLPDGLRANGYVADRQGKEFFQVTAQEGKAAVTLTVYGRGKEPALPHLPGGVPGRRIPAEPVNGRPAYWIFQPDPNGQSSFELRWQYAPGGWADLEGNGLRGDGAELTRTAYRIAESATFGGARPIAMPLHVDGVPGGLTPKRAVLDKGAFGEVSALLEFIVTGPSDGMSITATKSDGTMGTGVSGRPGKSVPGRPRPNTKLNGHPAYRSPSLVHVYGVNGFDIRISASGSVLARLDKTGGVVGLFNRTTVLGLDETNWTTNPVN
ncbi:hypothetical protein [Thermomonospora amylolytica]|uniref:hypothetical protein n=1 Tax=Thermomonospora amylolytica TaxID=1411117 RepID=UPI000E6CE3C9|nr:hypothetical protein [Thermomonospora amylolytica]